MGGTSAARPACAVASHRAVCIVQNCGRPIQLGVLDCSAFRPGGIDQRLQFREALYDARLLFGARLELGHVQLELAANGLFGVARFAALMDIVDHLLRTERNQHAERDDPQLPHHRIPPVRRPKLISLNMRSDPPAASLAVREAKSRVRGRLAV